MDSCSQFCVILHPHRVAVPFPPTQPNHWTKLIERTRPPEGVSYLLCSLIKNRVYEDPPRRICTRFFDGGPLTHGSWRGNKVNRKPPRGGRFLSKRMARLSSFVQIRGDSLKLWSRQNLGPPPKNAQKISGCHLMVQIYPNSSFRFLIMFFEFSGTAVCRQDLVSGSWRGSWLKWTCRKN